MLLSLHEESIARFGGMPGLRDEGLLESALARPRNLHALGGVTEIPRLAASCGFGLTRNHPFVDGNKRATVLAIAVFCALNHHAFDPDEGDEVQTIRALAAGETEEADFARWVDENSSARS